MELHNFHEKTIKDFFESDFNGIEGAVGAVFVGVGVMKLSNDANIELSDIDYKMGTAEVSLNWASIRLIPDTSSTEYEAYDEIIDINKQ